MQDRAPVETPLVDFNTRLLEQLGKAIVIEVPPAEANYALGTGSLLDLFREPGVQIRAIGSDYQNGGLHLVQVVVTRNAPGSNGQPPEFFQYCERLLADHRDLAVHCDWFEFLARRLVALGTSPPKNTTDFILFFVSDKLSVSSLVAPPDEAGIQAVLKCAGFVIGLAAAATAEVVSGPILPLVMALTLESVVQSGVACGSQVATYLRTRVAEEETSLDAEKAALAERRAREEDAPMDFHETRESNHDDADGSDGPDDPDGPGGNPNQRGSSGQGDHDEPGSRCEPEKPGGQCRPERPDGPGGQCEPERPRVLGRREVPDRRGEDPGASLA